jgi:hypothetical protein
MPCWKWLEDHASFDRYLTIRAQTNISYCSQMAMQTHPLRTWSRKEDRTQLPQDLPINSELKMSRIFFLGYKNVAAIGALILCLTQAPIARADSVSCLAKVSAYVAELDELLSKEKNWITPYDDLNARYFPFRDCEADALLEVVRSSTSFGRYLIVLAQGRISYISQVMKCWSVSSTTFRKRSPAPKPTLLSGFTNSGFLKCLRKFF